MGSWGYRDLDPWLRSGWTERGTAADYFSWKRSNWRWASYSCFEVDHLVSTVT